MTSTFTLAPSALLPMKRAVGLVTPTHWGAVVTDWPARSVELPPTRKYRDVSFQGAKRLVWPSFTQSPAVRGSRPVAPATPPTAVFTVPTGLPSRLERTPAFATGARNSAAAAAAAIRTARGRLRVERRAEG